MSEEKSGLKNVYKKTLAMDLCRLGHDIEHSMRNKRDKRFQVYVFKETPELIRDMLYLTQRNQINKRHNDV